MKQQIDTLIFDLGGVLVDWNPAYLYRTVFDSEEKVQWFLKNVCTPDWNMEQDAGRTIVEGEKQKIDLALLFTWRHVAKLKNSVTTNLLILDEVFDSSLDNNATEELLKILKGLGSATNLFVISHKGEVLFDKFLTTVRFDKVNGFSKIVDNV